MPGTATGKTTYPVRQRVRATVLPYLLIANLCATAAIKGAQRYTTNNAANQGEPVLPYCLTASIRVYSRIIFGDAVTRPYRSGSLS